MPVGADSFTRRHFAIGPFPARFNGAKGAVIGGGGRQIRQFDTRQVGQYLGAVLSSFINRESEPGLPGRH